MEVVIIDTHVYISVFPISGGRCGENLTGSRAIIQTRSFEGIWHQ